MGNEWGEARHRERRSPMDTGGRKIDPKTGKPEKPAVVQWWESIVKPKGKAREVTDPDMRERNEFWSRTYHARLQKGGNKEKARAHACYETLKAFGSTPFAKEGDPQP